MNAVDPFETAIAEAFPPRSWANTHVVVAVSGGADSCALLVALKQLKVEGSGEVIAAHFHHGLRGAAADADAAFVERFGNQLGVRVTVGRGDVSRAAATAGDGIEAAARAARYEFLRETAKQFGARYVATAHTADDQVETILHRLLRGTGIRGLAGMHWGRTLSDTVSLVRPMLKLRRVDVVAYLNALQLSFRDDETNSDLRFTRNRIRHELLPLLRASYNAEVDAALLRLGKLAYECQFTVSVIVGSMLSKAVTYGDNLVVIAESPLSDRPHYYVREMFMVIWQHCGWPEQSMGFAEWDALAEMAKQWPGENGIKRTFPGNIQATKKGEQLTLTRLG